MTPPLALEAVLTARPTLDDSPRLGTPAEAPTGEAVR
jgi:hypothetical protein